jgi:hypothetical protein
MITTSTYAIHLNTIALALTCKRILLEKDTEITKLRTSKGKEIEKLNIIINKMKDKVVSLQHNVQCLKKDMKCVYFDNQLKQREIRKDLILFLNSNKPQIQKCMKQ